MTAATEHTGRVQLAFAEHGVYFAPVRHHSPVCARALADLIAEFAPRQILVEAPVDYEPLAALLVDAETKPPVAIVTLRSASDRKLEQGGNDAGEATEMPSPISYFPFCDYSPEYVAIRAAQASGARLAFIDLPSGHRMMHAPTPIWSLADERGFSMNDYVQALCRRTGCRDHNEVWDHLFEQRLIDAPWREVFDAVGAYCVSVRRTLPTSQLESDGTLARELAMQQAIADALKRPERPIIVVTGGLHTPALIDAASAPSKPVGAKASRTTSAPPATPTRSYLVRYGFKELERLNGYAAGMPSPDYYQRQWEGRAGKRTASDLAADCLTRFSAHLKATRPDLAPTLPAVANALEHAIRLSALRGTPGPGRQDLIDAVTSCFIKEEVVANPVIEAFAQVLTGDAIGDVPPSAGSPPLVESVRKQARSLGFDLDRGTRRARELDIHRNDRHLAASRFLAGMSFLETGFATRISGPDFLGGHSRDILFETWQVAWSPMVEARLIALALYGDDLDTVLAARLADTVRRIRTDEGRSAVAAVRLLMTTCLIGLQERSAPVIDLIGESLEADPDIASVARALSDLFLMWRSRQVLGLAGSPRMLPLIGAAYRRVLALLETIADTKPERLGDVLQGISTLREVVASVAEETAALDVRLFEEAIGRLIDQRMAPTLSGAVAALAYLSGQRDDTFLVSRLNGQLAGAYVDVAQSVEALSGMIAMTRELLWRVPSLLSAFDRTLAGMDAEHFLAALPHLRLTFSALDPRETDKVAQQIAAAHGSHEQLATIHYDVSEHEIAANLAADLDLARSLVDDGLGAWIDDDVRPS